MTLVGVSQGRLRARTGDDPGRLRLGRTQLVTRPIKGLSDELHRLELRTGMRLRVPRRNAQDEIGRLVGDVNALIEKLVGLIDTERTLRLEREASEAVWR